VPGISREASLGRGPDRRVGHGQTKNNPSADNNVVRGLMVDDSRVDTSDFGWLGRSLGEGSTA